MLAAAGRSVLADRRTPAREEPSNQRLGIAIASSVPTVSPRLGVAEPKLMLPRVHPGALRRGRLLEMLDRLDGPALTVLNAGVGYGKTTLLRSWCTERPEPVIWMTLDAGDDDPVRLVDLLEDGACEVDPDGRVEVELPAYGYRWLRVVRPGSRRLL